MSSFEQLFQHIPRHGITVCKKCKYAIVPAQVNSHVQSQHPTTISKEERQRMVRSIAALSGIAKTPQEVRLPRQGQKPIKGLPILHDGFRCTHQTPSSPCNYICRTLTGIQKHCGDRHQWQNRRRRGKVPKEGRMNENNQAWEAKQPCQRLFHAR